MTLPQYQIVPPDFEGKDDGFMKTKRIHLSFPSFSCFSLEKKIKNVWCVHDILDLGNLFL
jgi:hypothetical protein